MDATEDYLCEGGRLLYLGRQRLLLVRRLSRRRTARDGGPQARYRFAGLAGAIRASSISLPRASNPVCGVRGAAPPQKIVGVGFTSEGMDESQPFAACRTATIAGSRGCSTASVRRKSSADFGLGLGGAAGIEIDRYDLALGTPPHALLLASSHGHSDNYPLVSEEVTYAFPGRGGTQDPQVRADIIYFTTAHDGAVFDRLDRLESGAALQERRQQCRQVHAKCAERLPAAGTLAWKRVCW